MRLLSLYFLHLTTLINFTRDFHTEYERIEKSHCGSEKNIIFLSIYNLILNLFREIHLNEKNNIKMYKMLYLGTEWSKFPELSN